LRLCVRMFFVFLTPERALLFTGSVFSVTPWQLQLPDLGSKIA
jgi:hypothetical protein